MNTFSNYYGRFFNDSYENCFKDSFENLCTEIPPGVHQAIFAGIHPEISLGIPLEIDPRNTPRIPLTIAPGGSPGFLEYLQGISLGILLGVFFRDSSN